MPVRAQVELISEFAEAMASHYEVLHVARDASAVVVKKAFRLLALRWHPDKQGQRPNGVSKEEATQRFQRIQGAYEVLSNESKRAVYDRCLRGAASETEATQGSRRYTGSKRARPAESEHWWRRQREENFRRYAAREQERRRRYEQRVEELRRQQEQQRQEEKRRREQWLEEYRRRQPVGQEQRRQEERRRHEQRMEDERRRHEQRMEERRRESKRRHEEWMEEHRVRTERAAQRWKKITEMLPQWHDMTFGERMLSILEIFYETT